MYLAFFTSTTCFWNIFNDCIFCMNLHSSSSWSVITNFLLFLQYWIIRSLRREESVSIIDPGDRLKCLACSSSISIPDLTFFFPFPHLNRWEWRQRLGVGGRRETGRKIDLGVNKTKCVHSRLLNGFLCFRCYYRIWSLVELGNIDVEIFLPLKALEIRTCLWNTSFFQHISQYI